jgi:hypothetical protein
LCPVIKRSSDFGEVVFIERGTPLHTPHQITIMSALFAQKAITGFAALAVAAAGTALPGSDAKAAPLIFDCY